MCTEQSKPPAKPEVLTHHIPKLLLQNDISRLGDAPEDQPGSLLRGDGDLLAGAHIFDGAFSGGDLILPQQNGVGNAQFVRVRHLLLEFLLLAVELHPDTGLPQGSVSYTHLTLPTKA